MPTIKQAIEEIYENGLTRELRGLSIKKPAIKTAFYGGERQFKGLFEREELIHKLNKPLTKNNLDEIIPDLQDCCLEHTHSSKNIIYIYNAMLQCIKKKYGIEVDLEIPEFNFRNEVDRQLFILKFFQENKERKLSDLQSVLWMYSRETLANDIHKINDGSLNFLGKRIEIEIDVNRDVVRVPSSAHPIILVENLTQILIQLEGLRKMSSNKAYEQYAHKTASEIWFQLTEYGRDRIVYVLKELMNEDVSWYDSLSLKEDYFYGEMHCSNVEGIGYALTCLKNNIPFHIRYLENGKEIEKYVKFTRGGYKGDIFILEEFKTKNKLEIHTDQILYIYPNKYYLSTILKNE